MSKSLSRALLRSSPLIVLISSSVTLASAAFANDPLEVVVTSERSEVPLKNTGSAITVITSEEIEKYGSKSIADVLRSVPGSLTSEAGGAGTTTFVTLRGGLPGQTLVMIDGVRIGDPSNIDGALDFGNLSPSNIDRIEVLRGPQSALYGSDAMSGVINIITKKGSFEPRRSVTFEAGSYGTMMVRAGQSGSTEKWTYSIGVSAFHSDAYPRYGYRSDLTTWNTVRTWQPEWPDLPSSEPVNKGGINSRFLYKVSDTATIDFGLSLYGNSLRIDNPGAFLFFGEPDTVYDPYNRSIAAIGNGYLRTRIDTYDGNLKNDFTVFANATDRNLWLRYGCFDTNYTSYDCRIGYQGQRVGFEYQGNLKVRTADHLIFGIRNEEELAQSDSTAPSYILSSDRLPELDGSQTTNSAFAEYRLALTDRFDVSLGGRIDALQGGEQFNTWRMTSAYRISEYGTKLRASYGTGAKAPTLYQNFLSSPGLRPEYNSGFDIGIDQVLLNERLNLSLTYFDVAYRDMITFDIPASVDIDTYDPATDQEPCMMFNINYSCYVNTAKVNSRGVEASASFDLVPDTFRLNVSYTHNAAIDAKLDRQIYRLPLNRASISLTYSGIKNLTIEPRLLLVGSNYDKSWFIKPNDVKLPGYARLDVYSNYKTSDKVDVFARIENLTDTRYNEIFNYGTPGRSFYAGVTYQW